MERDDVISKIRKLLALADGNANRNEAVAAALKAQKLIAEHDIEAYEIAGEEARREPVDIATDGYMRGVWREWLACTVADNFRCKSYQHNTRKRRGTLTHEVHFVGYDLDANAARLTYEKLVEVGERLALEECRRSRRALGHARGVKNDFLYGFVKGVRAELEKQCQALMLVCPAEVQEYFDGLDLRNAGKTKVKRTGARERGEHAGRDAVRSGRIGASDAPMLTAAC